MLGSSRDTLVQNVTNRMNGEGYSYNYDFSERIASGLPIIPGFGLKGSF